MCGGDALHTLDSRHLLVLLVLYKRRWARVHHLDRVQQVVGQVSEEGGGILSTPSVPRTD